MHTIQLFVADFNFCFQATFEFLFRDGGEFAARDTRRGVLFPIGLRLVVVEAAALAPCLQRENPAFELDASGFGFFEWIAHTTKTGIKAPDAMIVATALIYRAAVLHTFDPDLIALSELELVDGLKICHPCDPSGQKILI